MQYISCPKHGDGTGIDFSSTEGSNGTLAIVQKCTDEMIADGVAADAGTDVLGIYSTSGNASGYWDCLHRVSLGSRDTADIKFTRDGSHLVVWESPLQCSIQVLEVAFG